MDYSLDGGVTLQEQWWYNQPQSTKTRIRLEAYAWLPGIGDPIDAGLTTYDAWQESKKNGWTPELTDEFNTQLGVILLPGALDKVVTSGRKVTNAAGAIGDLKNFDNTADLLNRFHNFPTSTTPNTNGTVRFNPTPSSSQAGAHWPTSTAPGAHSTGSRPAMSGGRGLNQYGGVISQTGTNAAGGRIFMSTGTITQSDFAGIVDGSLMRGEEVHILTGAHGLPSGKMIADATMYKDDLRKFGGLPGVTIHNIASMSPNEIQNILQKPGTIIGGFCNSTACLSHYGQG